MDEDEPLFLSLISDLFPGIQLDNASYDELQTAITHQVEEAQLVNHPPWNLKIIQVSVQRSSLYDIHYIGFVKMRSSHFCDFVPKLCFRRTP